MSPLHDEDLLRDVALRQAVEAWRAAERSYNQPRHRSIGWPLIVIPIGMLVIVLLSLVRIG